jgi:hypothetical protein
MCGILYTKMVTAVHDVTTTFLNGRANHKKWITKGKFFFFPEIQDRRLVRRPVYGVPVTLFLYTRWFIVSTSVCYVYARWTHSLSVRDIIMSMIGCSIGPCSLSGHQCEVHKCPTCKKNQIPCLVRVSVTVGFGPEVTSFNLHSGI